MASACRLQVSLSSAVLCQIVSLQYLPRSSLHLLTGLPCCLFLTSGLHVVTREVYRSSVRRLIFHTQDHFICLTLLNTSMNVVLCLTHVALSILICIYILCDVAHTSFHFGMSGRRFVLCLFGQCPGLWLAAHMSLQADGKVDFEDIPVFVVSRSACHDSSLYLFVLVLFLEAVALSQVYVYPSTFSISRALLTFIGVLSKTITLVFVSYIYNIS